MQSHIPPSKRKGKETHHLTNFHQQRLFLPIFYFELQKKQQTNKHSRMSSSYSDDHIARDRLHAGITTCNIEKPQQKYDLKWSGTEHWGRGDLNWFHWIQTSPSASAVV